MLLHKIFLQFSEPSGKMQDCSFSRKQFARYMENKCFLFDQKLNLLSNKDLSKGRINKIGQMCVHFHEWAERNTGIINYERSLPIFDRWLAHQSWGGNISQLVYESSKIGRRFFQNAMSTPKVYHCALALLFTGLLRLDRIKSLLTWEIISRYKKHCKFCKLF